MENLKIVYMPLDELTPYENNARKHEKADIQTIENSIKVFGMCDPIGIWSDKNIIVEGHGRLLALKELGYTEAPCIRLDHLTDEQRRAYAIAHNKTAEMSEWDFDKLAEELAGISLDMEQFGFEDELVEGEGEDDTYTTKIEIPQYEMTREEAPEIELLCNTDKSAELIEEINKSNVSKKEKAFLKLAAARHNVFDYSEIAEYYAHATPEMQELMEKSALVIIDYEDAIANGYVKIKSDFDEVRELDEANNDEG